MLSQEVSWRGFLGLCLAASSDNASATIGVNAEAHTGGVGTGLKCVSILRALLVSVRFRGSAVSFSVRVCLWRSGSGMEQSGGGSGWWWVVVVSGGGGGGGAVDCWLPMLRGCVFACGCACLVFRCCCVLKSSGNYENNFEITLET